MVLFSLCSHAALIFVDSLIVLIQRLAEMTGAIASCHKIQGI